MKKHQRGHIEADYEPWRPLTRLKQWLCSHRVAWTDVRRVSAERVECPCLRCGKVLSAAYGVALNATWQQPSPAQLERLYAEFAAGSAVDGVPPSSPDQSKGGA